MRAVLKALRWVHLKVAHSECRMVEAKDLQKGEMRAVAMAEMRGHSVAEMLAQRWVAEKGTGRVAMKEYRRVDWWADMRDSCLAVAKVDQKVLRRVATMVGLWDVRLVAMLVSWMAGRWV